jgi:molybdopterin-guanine dinucleotide biosynthesis protein A
MPFLTPAAMHKLAAGPDDAHAAYAITPDGPEPLAAIVKLSALHSLEAMIALDDIPRTHVALDRAGAICIWFSDPAPFRNINTHAELESAGRG